MDVSSEMIHALLPVFLVGTLGASVGAVGWIEGAAEAIASVTKVFSGALSDAFGRRKPLAVAGYGLAAVTKPLFALAPSVAWVVAARCIDRVGKGIRGAPRDALVGELAPPEIRGASYGLRQSLDTVGAFAGPLLATALMAATGDAIRTVFWIAVVPAVASVALLAGGVREPDRVSAPAAVRAPIRLADLRALGPAYRAVVAAATVAALARCSEAFLILRAHDAGLATALAPLVLVAMNAAYAASAFPLGRLADRADRRVLIAAGFGVLALAHAALAVGGLAFVAAGVLLWGLHMGMTQGIFAALVADAVPAARRGTAFGVFHLAGGVATLAASAGAGWLWDRFGAPAAFGAGAALALCAVATTRAIPRAPAP
jgi:MFS family permease